MFLVEKLAEFRNHNVQNFACELNILLTTDPELDLPNLG